MSSRPIESCIQPQALFCSTPELGFYIKIASDTMAVLTGAFVELIQTAEAQGSVTPEEIASILNIDELPVTAQVS